MDAETLTSLLPAGAGGAALVAVIIHLLRQNLALTMKVADLLAELNSRADGRAQIAEAEAARLRTENDDLSRRLAARSPRTRPAPTEGRSDDSR